MYIERSLEACADVGSELVWHVAEERRGARLSKHITSRQQVCRPRPCLVLAPVFPPFRLADWAQLCRRSTSLLPLKTENFTLYYLYLRGRVTVI